VLPQTRRDVALVLADGFAERRLERVAITGSAGGELRRGARIELMLPLAASRVAAACSA
jgi:hypothetical protein